MGIKTLTALLVMSFAMSLACSPNEERVELVDEGQLCFNAPGTAETFEAEAPIDVTVEAQECLSASCEIDRRAECSVAINGSDIVVHSSLKWTETGDDMCTADCGEPTAHCMSEPVPAGDFVVNHGTAKYDFSVPQDEARVCFN
jgi:hypothetical protein